MSRILTGRHTETSPRIDQTKVARRKEVVGEKGGRQRHGQVPTSNNNRRKTWDGDGTVVLLGVWARWRLAAAQLGVAPGGTLR